MIIKSNKRFAKIFQDYIAKHPTSYGSSYGYSGYSSYGNNSYTSYCDGPRIYFYEWSSMLNGAKNFRNLEAFENFLKMNHITYSNEAWETIKNNDLVYCTCEPDAPILMVETKYNDLRELLEKKKTRLNILKARNEEPCYSLSVPTVPFN